MNAWRAAAAIGVVALAAGCASLSAERPIEGHVVDADTARPVAGAVVRLDRWVRCRGSTHPAHVHGRPASETVTDATGAFSLADPPWPAPCASADALHMLTIAAPGYLPESAEPLSPRGTAVRLAPIRYRSELDVVARRIAARARDADGPRPGGAVWDATVAALARAPIRTLGAPGLFASRPGAAFDRIAVLRGGVLRDLPAPSLVVAQDRASGAFVAWTPRGDAVPEPMPGDRDVELVGGEHAGPIVTRPGVILLRTPSAGLGDLGTPAWFVLPAQAGRVRAVVQAGDLLSLEDDGRRLARYDLQPFTDFVLPRRALREPRAVRAAGLVTLTDVLPGLAGPAACMFDDDLTNRVTFLGPGADGATIFHLTVAGEPAAWRGAAGAIEPPLRARVTACTSAVDGLYAAMDDGRLVRVRLTRDGERWRAQVSASARLARPITSLAVGAIGTEHGPRPSRVEVVYAVTGDDTVYRFTADLRPDERIAVGQADEKGPSASLAPSAARSTYREYASRAAFGRRLASGPF